MPRSATSQQDRAAGIIVTIIQFSGLFPASIAARLHVNHVSSIFAILGKGVTSTTFGRKDAIMTHYLQSSGIFGLLAILTGFIVAIAGILVLLFARSRRAHMIAVISAGLPILVGAAGTLIGYFMTRDLVLNSPHAQDATRIHAWHSELASPAIVGAATALPLFVLL
jgi:hypothetical protein